MTDTNSKEIFDAVPDTHAQTTDFEALLGRAQRLLNSSDFEGALEQLLILQEKYVAATRLFDMIGDAYMRGLDFRQGVRYKTLYEVLTSTLGAQRLVKPRLREGDSAQMPQTTEPEPAEQAVREQAEAVSPPPTHCTAAMGQELLRQGHFDKAMQIFERLLEKNPQDESLLEGKETARRKSRERRSSGGSRALAAEHRAHEIRPVQGSMTDQLLGLHRRLERLGVDALLFSTSEAVTSVNVRHLSGFTGSEAAILITLTERHLFTDGRYKTQAAEETRGISSACGAEQA